MYGLLRVRNLSHFTHKYHTKIIKNKTINEHCLSYGTSERGNNVFKIGCSHQIIMY
jgi:hypothetical protein